jgi:hypothetical protein
MLEYLLLIGEHRKGEGLHHKKVPISLYRLAKAIDLLVEKEMILIGIQSSVFDYVVKQRASLVRGKLLQTTVVIKMTNL